MSTRTEYPNFVGNTGKFLKVNATETDVLWDEVDASDITGVLGIDHGGTGADNANDALNNLLPDQTGHVGEVLHTDGTDTYWSADLSAGVQSVTGLDTDNTDPSNPIVQIAVDGVTVTGDGTPGNPLASTGGLGGVDTREYQMDSATTYQNSTNVIANDGILSFYMFDMNDLDGIPFLENVVVKRMYFKSRFSVPTGSPAKVKNSTVTVYKNGITTGITSPVVFDSTQDLFFDITINESFAASDKFSIRYTLPSVQRLNSAVITGTFVLGETVTGATSGTTGTFVAQSGSYIIVEDTSGLFTIGEAVNGATASATNVSSIIYGGSTVETYTIVQTSGGTPLGVQSVTGNGVDNTDPFNPAVQTADTSTEGTLTAADWNTFNGKQDALPTLCLVKAYQSALGSGGTPFIANTEVFDTTSSYDNTTGIFTAPRTGYYLVTGSFSIESHSIDPSIASAQIIKNGSTGVDQDSVRYNGTEGASDFWKRRLKLVSTVQLTSGDTIEFDVAVNTGTIGVTGGVEGNQITITELR